MLLSANSIVISYPCGSNNTSSTLSLCYVTTSIKQMKLLDLIVAWPSLVQYLDLIFVFDTSREEGSHPWTTLSLLCYRSSKCILGHIQFNIWKKDESWRKRAKKDEKGQKKEKNVSNFL